MLKRFVVFIFCTCYPTEPVLHCTGAVVITLAQSFKAPSFFFRFCTSPGVSDGSVMSVCFVSCLPDCFAPLIYICQPQLTSPLCIICCTSRQDIITLAVKMMAGFFIIFIVIILHQAFVSLSSLVCCDCPLTCVDRRFAPCDYDLVPLLMLLSSSSHCLLKCGKRITRSFPS